MKKTTITKYYENDKLVKEVTVEEDEKVEQNTRLSIEEIQKLADKFNSIPFPPSLPYVPPCIIPCNPRKHQGWEVWC